MAQKYLDENGLSYFKSKLDTLLSYKQSTLISGTNIKTINNNSILGDGDLSTYPSFTNNAGKVLKVNSGETGVEWVTESSGGMTNPMTTQGDIIIGGSSGSPSRLAKGSADQVLTMDSSGLLPSWVTPIDTKPQYLYHYNSSLKNTSGGYIYRYQMLVFNGTGLAPFTTTNNSTSTSKTQSNPKYYPQSPIYYYKSTTSVSNNSTITGSSLYNFYYSIDLRYSFNIATNTLTKATPVYLKMSINTDGSLSPVYSASSGGHPLVQSLPSSEDGYVYVYLGNTNSSTAYYLELELNHPCFWYKDGKILPYGGGGSSGTTVTFVDWS